MTPLQSIQSMLMWYGLCSAKKDEAKWKKIAYILSSIFLLGSEICGLIASVTFILKNASIDMEGSVYAFLQTAATSSVSNSIIAALLVRGRLAKVLRKLTEFYSACKQLTFCDFKL